MKDEIFGPILPVITYKNIDEAITFIQNRPKPLATYYFGSNSIWNNNLSLVQKRTSSGAFVVNECCTQIFNCDLPFGGVGMSGYGRYHGKQGFDECSNIKSVFRKHARNYFPFTLSCAPFNQFNIPKLQFMIKWMPGSQAKYAKMFVLFLVVIWILWLIATKRITMKKLRKYKAMISMVLQAMRG